MVADEVSFKRALRMAWKEPARALVLVWQYARVQGNLEDLHRPTCEVDAEKGRKALERGESLPSIHPAAALRAIDEYMADYFRLGHAPFRRMVRLHNGADGKFWVVSRRAGWKSRLAENQCGHPEFWLRHFQVFPATHQGIAIDVKAAPRAFLKPTPQNLTFVAGGFLDGVFPDWNETSPLHCQVLKDPNARWSSVEQILDDAAKNGTAIVVLPELTIDADVRSRIRNWLRESRRESPFALVVAGSFHEDEKGVWRNIAYVYDDDGDVVHRHIKLRPMRAMKKDEWVEEDISGGTGVSLMHAWFGLVGVAVCLDFCEEGDVPVTDLWRVTGPTLMLVPSMGTTSTNSAHQRKTDSLARQHGTVAVVASQNGTEVEAFGIYLDGSKEVTKATPALRGSLPWTLD